MECLTVKRLFLIFFCLIIICASSFGQSGSIPVSYNRPGAKARAMGQTFIGISDDASAVDYNPSGLIQIQNPEISAELKYTFEKHNNHLPVSSFNNGRASHNNFDDDYFTPSFFGFVYPFEKFTLALSEYSSINFEHSFTDKDSVPIPFRYKQNLEMQLNHIALSGAYSISSWLDVGATIKAGEFYLYRMNSNYISDYKQNTRTSDSDKDDVYGYNLGLMLKPLDSLSIGLVYKSEEDADIEIASNRYDYDLPQYVGLGLNYKINERWNIAADVDWTEWSEFDKTNSYNMNTGGTQLRWKRDDVISYHFGTEYKPDIFENISTPLRFGYYYQPTTSAYDTINVPFTIEDNVDDEHHFTTGFGMYWNIFQIDFAVDYSEDKTDLLLSSVIKF